jgi:hypothetical protein
MLVSRGVAGTFGGPASALALAIVSDIVPPERRGQAMGKVLGAFAVASVLGVPAGLEIAHLGGFRLPFFAVAALGVVVTAGAMLLLPPLTGHLERLGKHRSTFLELIRRPGVAVALSCNGLVMFGHFALVPNLAAYFQFNFGFPRDGLGFLYFVGGTISFATMRLAGMLADRFGAPLIEHPVRIAAVSGRDDRAVIERQLGRRARGEDRGARKERRACKRGANDRERLHGALSIEEVRRMLHGCGYRPGEFVGSRSEPFGWAALSLFACGVTGFGRFGLSPRGALVMRLGTGVPFDSFGFIVEPCPG